MHAVAAALLPGAFSELAMLIEPPGKHDREQIIRDFVEAMPLVEFTPSE